MNSAHKSNYHWTVWLLTAALFLLNEWVLGLFFPGDFRLLKALPLLRVFSAYLFLSLVWLVVQRKSLGEMIRASGSWNLFSLAAFSLLFLLSNRLRPGQYEALRLLFVLGLLLQTVRLMRLLILQKRQELSAWQLNLRTTVAMTFISLLLLEGAFIFVAESHGHLRTFAAINWAQRHFEVNSMGFRDPEPPAIRGNKPLLLIAGDSFAAGGGVNDPADRFGDRLAEAWKEEIEVINVARNGADTPEELDIVRKFPLKPDKVLLTYFGNDIMGRVPEGRISAKLPHEYSHLPQPLRFFVHHSHFLDYLCWHLPVWGSRSDFLSEIKKVYEDPDIWEVHRRDLKSWIRWSRAESVELEVVIFPFMGAVEESTFYTDKVAAFFEAEGVSTINLQPLFSGYPTSELVANVNDGHPNAFAHKLAAQRILSSQ